MTKYGERAHPSQQQRGEEQIALLLTRERQVVRVCCTGLSSEVGKI